MDKLTKERSLILLKPDVIARGLVGEIISRFERVGLKMVAMKMEDTDIDIAKIHYKKDEDWLITVGKRLIENKDLGKDEDPKKYGQEVCDQLSEDLTVYPIVAIVFEGHDTVRLVRKMVGDTSPENAAPGTIRGDYSQDTYAIANALNRPVLNLIHASDTPEHAEEEIKLWFKEDELTNWCKPDEAVKFRGKE